MPKTKQERAEIAKQCSYIIYYNGSVKTGVNNFNKARRIASRLRTKTKKIHGLVNLKENINA